MGTITVSKTIAAPIEQVFKVFTDLDSKTDQIESVIGIEKLTDGPFGEGTRWRETRLMFKKEAIEEMWITGFDAPNRYTTNAESHGMRYTTVFNFTKEGDSTNVSWAFTGKALKLSAKIMAPVMGLLMNGMMKKFMKADIEALGEACEKQG